MFRKTTAFELLESLERVDAVITDIPYGVTQNPIDVLPDLKELFRLVFSKTNVFITTIQGKALQEVLKAIPSNIKWYDLVWDRELVSGHLNAKRMPMRQHELILIMYKKPPTYNPQMWKGEPSHSKGTLHLTKDITNRNYGKMQSVDQKGDTTIKYPRSIIKFQKPHPSKAIHATEKPVALYEWLIKTYTNEGDLVCDPYAGSGTTAIAAINTKRNFVGSELDEDIYNCAKNRINKTLKEVKND